MWPFKKKPKPTITTVPADQISFSQLDITERFGDNERLTESDWVTTSPLNAALPNPEKRGLPAVGVSAEVVYSVASNLSAIRESFAIVSDGVYCPICHVANTSLNRLRAPCPRCGRPLLRFGWE